MFCMEKKYFLISCLFTMFVSFPVTLFSQTNNVTGEAQIIQRGSEYYLVNYDKEYPISSDHSFELTSTSFVYLTLKTDISIKSIQVAGYLRIQGEGGSFTLTVGGESDVPETAIKCGALDVRNEVDLKVSASLYGIDSDTYIEMACGTHYFSSSANQSGSIAIRAGSYLSLAQCANVYTTDDSGNGHYFETALHAGSQVMVNEGRLVAKASKYGIRCGGLQAKKGANIQAEIASPETAGSEGLLVTGKGNVLVESGASLIASGSLSGVRVEQGLIRVDNAVLQGTCGSITGTYNAVHAPGRIYALNGGEVNEVYVATGAVMTPASVLQDYPLIANNMYYALDYQWSEVGNDVKALRTVMKPQEKVRIDNRSLHNILFVGASLNSATAPKMASICVSFNTPVNPNGFWVEGYATMVDDGGIPVGDIKEYEISVTFPNGTVEKTKVAYGPSVMWLVISPVTLNSGDLLEADIKLIFENNEDGKYDSFCQGHCCPVRTVVGSGV